MRLWVYNYTVKKITHSPFNIPPIHCEQLPLFHCNAADRILRIAPITKVDSSSLCLNLRGGFKIYTVDDC